MKRISVLIIFFLGCSLPGYQQSLQIGDTIPDLRLSVSNNGKISSIHLSDLKFKLLILDFWSVTCTACITYFPEIDSLRNAFEGKLQFILVTDNSAPKVEAFLAKFKRIKLPQVPSITGDTILSKLFYHVTIPHHVWIDSNRVVRAITSGYNTTASTIETFLIGKDPGLFVKHEVKGLRLPVPGAEGNQDALLYYSYIIKNIQGIRGGGLGFILDSASHKKIGFKIDATPVIELYKIAWGRNLFNSPFRYDNRIILYARKPGKYLMPADITKYDAWADTNTFYYFLKLHVKKANEIYDFMQIDLERFFGLKAKIEKREINCLALVRTTAQDLIHSAGKDLISVSDEEGRLQLSNSNMGSLVAGLSYTLRNISTPVVDETGYRLNIDILLNTKPADLPSIRKQLNVYGLDLIEKKIWMDMLVLRE
ncbi:MAG TPA: redoxin domain-containing protein [Chitinophagaceae bacterium]|nr:redoxin domain-containing protein [Chitinophagaceae bacterium]